AHEVAHAARLAEEVDDSVIVLDVDHQIARIALALLDDALAVAHLGNTLYRDDDLSEEVLESFDLDAALDGVLDGLFAAALDFDDIPFIVVVRRRRRRLLWCVWRRLWRGSAVRGVA